MTAIDRRLADIEAEQRLANAERFLGALYDAKAWLPDNDPLTRAQLFVLIDRIEYSVNHQREALLGGTRMELAQCCS